MQQRRSRSSRLESTSTYSCQQPLTIDISPSHYEMSTCLGDTVSEPIVIANGDAHHNLPLNSLGSPLQLSQKVSNILHVILFIDIRISSI